jgi:hypothetical protein
MNMRIAMVLGILAAMAATTPAWSQGYGPKLGELEVKAYQVIPRTKTAVQLTSDTALARNLRREVMIRLARRGNEVGFSGGNVMRMDVTYIDLLGGGSNSNSSTFPGGGSQYDGPGANPRPDLPRNTLRRLDALPAPSSGPTLRITLTLYAVDTGKVLWVATASCQTQGGQAEQAGIAIIDNIFSDADKNRVGDAGCPL